MSDNDLTPYTGHDIALPSDGGAISIPDYSQVPAKVRDAFMPSPYGGGDHHAPAPYQQPGATSGHQAFGVPLPAGITPAEALGRLEDLGNAFRIHARRNNISRGATDLAIGWVMGNALRPVPRHVERRHGYDLTGVPVDASLELFANAMHEAGVLPRDFAGMMSFYANLAKAAPQPTAGRYGGTAVSDDEYQRAIDRSEGDAQACETALRQRWGVEYVSRLRTVRNHVASLPAAQRDMIESSILQDGMAALNHPDVIARLYHEAVGGQPADLAGEIANIEHVMKTDRRRYNVDIKMQERLRFLYGQRGY